MYTIATSDTIKGPFKLVNEMLYPGGMNSGDFEQGAMLV